MMPGVTVGDLLLQADDSFEQALAGPGRLDAGTAIPYLRRLTLTITRYLSDSSPPDTPKLAAALTLAATRLETAEAAIAGSPRPGPRMRALARAADLLTAGADLVETHSTTGPDGYRRDRSDWARLLSTQMVAVALAEEVTHWADRIAHLCATLGVAPGSPFQADLKAAETSLRKATAELPDAAEVGNGRVVGWELLYAIPSVAPSAKKPPSTTESADQLAERVAVSAERLKAAAFIMSEQASWSSTISVQSWRNEAHIAAIILDASRRALDRAARREDGTGLRAAAVTLDAAHAAWEQIAGAEEVFAADTDAPGARMSLASVEAGELALPLCRLVFDDPGWKPSRGGNISAEAVAAMDDPDRFSRVLSAVHRATDAIARMGTADLETIRLFAQARRLYMPNKILEDGHAGMRRYIEAPTGRVELLTQAYQAAIKQTTRAADALDELVVRYDGPSRVLAMARKALRLEEADQVDMDVSPEDVALRLRYLDRPVYARGVPREQIDAHAVVRAYRDDQLTLQQCADRFATSSRTIRSILDERDVPIRSGGHPNQSDPPDYTAPEDVPRGPVEREVRARGLDDPDIVTKARDLDRAIARARLETATTEVERRIRYRTAAQLARTDHPETLQDSAAGDQPTAPARVARAPQRRTPRTCS